MTIYDAVGAREAELTGLQEKASVRGGREKDVSARKRAHHEFSREQQGCSGAVQRILRWLGVKRMGQNYLRSRRCTRGRVGRAARGGECAGWKGKGRFCPETSTRPVVAGAAGAQGAVQGIFCRLGA